MSQSVRKFKIRFRPLFYLNFLNRLYEKNSTRQFFTDLVG